MIFVAHFRALQLATVNSQRFRREAKGKQKKERAIEKVLLVSSFVPHPSFFVVFDSTD